MLYIKHVHNTGYNNNQNKILIFNASKHKRRTFLEPNVEIRLVLACSHIRLTHTSDTIDLTHRTFVSWTRPISTASAPYYCLFFQILLLKLKDELARKPAHIHVYRFV